MKYFYAEMYMCSVCFAGKLQTELDIIPKVNNLYNFTVLLNISIYVFMLHMHGWLAV